MLLDPNGVSGALGGNAAPLDFDFESRGRFLYVLDASGDRISAFRRNHDGSLALLATSIAVLDGSAGLLAR